MKYGRTYSIALHERRETMTLDGIKRDLRARRDLTALYAPR